MKNIKLFEQFSGIEDKERLSEPIVKILNEQIKNELESSQIYRSMSCWCDNEGWIGGQKLFFKYADEELLHMTKIYNYLFDKNCKAVVPSCEKPQENYKDMREILETALNHEFEITENWNNIANLALKGNDNNSYSLAQWYIEEQKEEEEKIRNILFKMNLDLPKYELDELLDDLSK
jgi:ferritin